MEVKSTSASPCHIARLIETLLDTSTGIWDVFLNYWKKGWVVGFAPGSFSLILKISYKPTGTYRAVSASLSISYIAKLPSEAAWRSSSTVAVTLHLWAAWKAWWFSWLFTGYLAAIPTLDVQISVYLDLFWECHFLELAPNSFLEVETEKGWKAQIFKKMDEKLHKTQVQQKCFYHHFFFSYN